MARKSLGRASDLQLSHEFVPCCRTISWLVPGWVTIFGWAYHLGM